MEAGLRLGHFQSQFASLFCSLVRSLVRQSTSPLLRRRRRRRLLHRRRAEMTNDVPKLRRRQPRAVSARMTSESAHPPRGGRGTGGGGIRVCVARALEAS